MYRSRPISLALVGLFVWVTACQTYTQIEIGEVANHGKVRVTLADGERETVRDPRVESDSIKGLGKKVGGGISDRRPLAIPLDQVSTLEAVSVNQGRTGLLIMGVAVCTMGVIYVAYCLSEESYMCF